MSWSLLTSSSASGRTYARPLGLNERSFYFDRVFNGTADIVWRYLVQETSPPNALFTESNVSRAWATLKQWYPLLGAHLNDSNGIDAVHFILSERDLSHHHPDEINFLSAKSSEEVEAYVWMLQRDKPTQDHHLISRLFIFKLDGQHGKYEVLIRIAHAIGDGISGATIARTFFDVLTSPPAPLPNLEERLAMALPTDFLNPTRNLSPAQQKWRRAIARVIFLNRRRKLAVRTFPFSFLPGRRQLTHSTPGWPHHPPYNHREDIPHALYNRTRWLPLLRPRNRRDPCRLPRTQGDLRHRHPCHLSARHHAHAPPPLPPRRPVRRRMGAPPPPAHALRRAHQPAPVHGSRMAEQGRRDGGRARNRLLRVHLALYAHPLRLAQRRGGAEGPSGRAALRCAHVAGAVLLSRVAVPPAAQDDHGQPARDGHRGGAAADVCAPEAGYGDALARGEKGRAAP